MWPGAGSTTYAGSLGHGRDAVGRQGVLLAVASVLHHGVGAVLLLLLMLLLLLLLLLPTAGVAGVVGATAAGLV